MTLRELYDRSQKLDAIRRDIDRGTYLDAAKMDAAADRLADELAASKGLHGSAAARMPDHPAEPPPVVDTGGHYPDFDRWVTQHGCDGRTDWFDNAVTGVCFVLLVAAWAMMLGWFR